MLDSDLSNSHKITKNIILVNKLGLHARASARLVSTADRFESEVYLTRLDNQHIASAKSIMGLMMLAAPCGTKFMLSAEGPDAETAVSAVYDLISHRFGEEE